MKRILIEKADIYKALLEYKEGNKTMAEAIDSIPAADIMTADFINTVHKALIDAGQMDTEKFKWGESIRYTPSEVRDILTERLLINEIEITTDGKMYKQLTAEAIERGI